MDEPESTAATGIPLGLCQCGCGQSTTISPVTILRYGYVKGQPRRYVRGHYDRRPPAGLLYRPGDDVKHRFTDWPWKIPLRRTDGTVRAFALVDEADYVWVSAYRWHRMTIGYVARNTPGRSRSGVLLHRMILGLEPGDRREGDHIWGDRLDHRRSELRILPPKTNQQNQPSHQGSSSRYRGVTWNKREHKWMARVHVGGRVIHLGYFTDEDEAGGVADAARTEHMPYSIRALTAEPAR
jgi:hypothetical protein